MKRRYDQAPWRVGRKVGRTIYAQLGPEPADGDPLIGVMDSRRLAAAAVQGHNETIRWPTGAFFDSG